MSLQALPLDPYLLAGIYREPLVPAVPAGEGLDGAGESPDSPGEGLNTAGPEAAVADTASAATAAAETEAAPGTAALTGTDSAAGTAASAGTAAPAGTADPVSETLAPPLRSLGGNRRQVLVIVEDASTAFLDEEQFAFFTKILGAVQHSMADIALVNLAHSPGMSFGALQEQFRPRKVLLFGDALAELPAQRNAVLQTTEKLPLLRTDTLQQLESDRERKRLFWGALKLFFS
ncbi:hypothetical protein [Compostibacter hankyongensis]